jgi:hypothetical protein
VGVDWYSCHTNNIFVSSIIMFLIFFCILVACAKMMLYSCTGKDHHRRFKVTSISMRTSFLTGRQSSEGYFKSTEYSFNIKI